MVQIETPDIFGRFQQGVAQGEDSRRRKTLSDYLQPAISGDKQALGMVFNADPSAGLQAQALSDKRQAQIGDEEFARLERLGKTARTIVSLPPQLRRAAYQQALPELSKSFPGEWAPDWSEDMLPLATQLAQALDPESAEQFTLAPGSKRFDASGKVVAEAPFAPANLQTLPTDQGYATFDPRTGSTAPLSYGGVAPGGLPPVPGINLDRVQATIARLKDLFPNVRMTSGLRTPEHNAAVGGVPNSQHLRGTAGDFAVPADQKAAFIAAAQRGGLEALDEGDHVHVELPPGASTGGGDRVQPPQKQAGSELEQRIALARYLGASEEEIRRMVIGREGAAAGAKPLPPSVLKLREETIAEAETAKTINKSLDKHIGLIEGGKLSFGPVDNLWNQGRNAAGMSNEGSRNFAEFRSDLEKLRNDSLRLNAGVQTDGDAQRAWNELFSNLSDTAYVKQRLQTIRRINERAETLKRAAVERIDSEYGRDQDAAAPALSGSDAPASGGGDIEALLEKYK